MTKEVQGIPAYRPISTQQALENGRERAHQVALEVGETGVKPDINQVLRDTLSKQLPLRHLLQYSDNVFHPDSPPMNNTDVLMWLMNKSLYEPLSRIIAEASAQNDEVPPENRKTEEKAIKYRYFNALNPKAGNRLTGILLFCDYLIMPSANGNQSFEYPAKFENWVGSEAYKNILTHKNTLLTNIGIRKVWGKRIHNIAAGIKNQPPFVSYIMLSEIGELEKKYLVTSDEAEGVYDICELVTRFLGEGEDPQIGVPLQPEEHELITNFLERKIEPLT